MKSHAHRVRASLQQIACVCTILFIGTIAISDEPTVSSAGAKLATPAVPVVQVFKPVAFVLCTSEGQGARRICVKAK